MVISACAYDVASADRYSTQSDARQWVIYVFPSPHVCHVATVIHCLLITWRVSASIMLCDSESHFCTAQCRRNRLTKSSSWGIGSLVSWNKRAVHCLFLLSVFFPAICRLLHTTSRYKKIGANFSRCPVAWRITTFVVIILHLWLLYITVRCSLRLKFPLDRVSKQTSPSMSIWHAPRTSSMLINIHVNTMLTNREQKKNTRQSMLNKQVSCTQSNSTSERLYSLEVTAATWTVPRG